MNDDHGRVAAGTALIARPSVAKGRGLAAVGALMLAGCGFRSSFPEGRDDTVRARLPPKFPGEILEKAERLQVVALEEEGAFSEQLVTYKRASIRAVVDVDSPAVREQLIRAMYRGIRDATLMALCFEPHHAIRAWRDGAVVEIVVCDHCLEIALPTGDGSFLYRGVKPFELADLFDKLFEARSLRFDPTKGTWVPEG